MYRWRNSILWIALAFSFSSCGFIDLRVISFSVVPGTEYSVLSNTDTPVIVKFDTAMDQQETQQVLSINNNAGKVEGDLVWQGNDLYFYPVKGWSPGIKYTITVSGTVYSRDGRDLRVSRFIPFYAVSRSPVPYLASFTPLDGESVGVRVSGGAAVVLDFSLPMHPRSTEDAFSWDCPGEKEFTWSNGNRRLQVASKDTLTAWTNYRWTIKDTALSQDGVPMDKTVSGHFTTNQDTVFPTVSRTFPMVRSGVNWNDSGGSLTADLGRNQGIGVQFSKPMNAVSMLQSIRFEPTISGRSELINDTSFIFIPDRELEPKTTYTLIISKETTDGNGLKLGTDYIEYFVPDLPFLEILSVSIEGNSYTGTDLENGKSHQVTLTNPGVMRVTFHFSLALTGEAKVAAASRILLDVYFPGNLNLVTLRAVESAGADKITFEWEGLETGTTGPGGIRNFYKLSLPGGKGGLNNGSGAYLEENRSWYVEVVP